MTATMTPLQRILESQRLARLALTDKSEPSAPTAPSPSQAAAPKPLPDAPRIKFDLAKVLADQRLAQEQEKRDREAAILADTPEPVESFPGPVDGDTAPEFDRSESASLSVLASATDIMAGVNFQLDPSQQQAVVGMVREQFACMIGAAGTGKTTTTRKVLSTLVNGDAEYDIEPLRISAVNLTQYHARTQVEEDATDPDTESDEWDTLEPSGDKVVPSIALVAFTGQATQVLRRNMPGTWKSNVMTIHSLLGYAPVDYIREDGSTGMRFEPSYTAQFKMPWDVIFIDEASMVNVMLWHQILDAAKPGCRFYMIGDLNQLTPPVGDGILGFALARWPVFELTTVHRQKDEAANRIIDTAWRVLRGQQPEYDDPKTNPNWRVIGFPLEHDASKAHMQVLSIARALSQKKVHESVDPAQPAIYDPWRDRIMTPTNGFNESDPSALLGQFPLNDSLSRIFAGEHVERVVIDYKKGFKKFAEGYRIMATKNEPPSTIDRVTNGLTGKIISIVPNPQWLGDWRLVGPETEVASNRKEMLAQALDKNAQMKSALELAQQASDALDTFSFSANTEAKEERQSGPASHIIDVVFDSGATRTYTLNAEIEQLQIAYASTTHKAQGAEMPTAIIVIHHSQKRMLCRENLYTAVTRASQRVVILSTDYAMRIALMTQKINGKTLAEKVKQYQQMMGDEGGGGFRQINVRLSQENA